MIYNNSCTTSYSYCEMMLTTKKPKKKTVKVHRSVKFTRYQMKKRIWRTKKKYNRNVWKRMKVRLKRWYKPRKKMLVFGRKRKKLLKFYVEDRALIMPNRSLNRAVKYKRWKSLKFVKARWFGKKRRLKKLGRKKRKWWNLVSYVKVKKKRRKSQRKKVKLKRQQPQKRKQVVRFKGKAGLKGKFRGKWNQGRRPKRLMKRSNWISPWRLYLRRKKIDKQVRIVWRKGEKTRRITKLGGRTIYRPLKRKFPRWWKLSRVNKQMKKRRGDKKIFGFRWLHRSRNPIEMRMIRRRKFYSRRKRIADFLLWKLFVPKSMMVRFLNQQKNAMNVFGQFGGVSTNTTPGLDVRRYQRLTSMPEMKRYRQSGKKNKMVNNSVYTMNNSSHSSSLISMNDASTVNVLRYPILKRYRRKKRWMNTTLSTGVNVAQMNETGFENSLSAWRHNAWLAKNRVDTLRRQRLSASRKSVKRWK